MHQLIFLISTLGFSLISLASLASINISTPQALLDNEVSRNAIIDVQELLKDACNCTVSINEKDRDITIVLPSIDSAEQNALSEFAEGVPYPYSHYPNHYYSWHQKKVGDKTILTLKTPSFEGVSNALYGLLQELLGFKFFHPKETYLPSFNEWPLQEEFVWEATPRFDKKGFHLHTQHPLELTEQLLDESYPDALLEVKEYIDWLARNGQNYFEFNLLEGISYKYWPAHAKAMVDYAHQRGVLAGVDISLHMIQQKAWMLYKSFPNSARSKRKQIEQNLEWLFQADWDYVSMEFSTTEFTEGNVANKERLRLYIGELIRDKYNAKLMGRVHVVQEDNMVNGDNHDSEYEMIPAEKELDSYRGVLAHTVMFYSTVDDVAPVYGNENLKHMLQIQQDEQNVRETWYYPESAYWITFDNSVPMLLLPYLSGRLADIEAMERIGAKGHLTFSSGWEWGYWLVDWSIARWSWSYSYNNKDIKYDPSYCIHDLFNSQTVSGFFSQMQTIHDNYLRDQNVMQFLCPHTITDELKLINLQLQPRLKWHYPDIRNTISSAQLDSLELEMKSLNAFANQSTSLINQFKQEHLSFDDQRNLLLEELTQGLEITTLRAQHKIETLNYLITHRRNGIAGETSSNISFLEKASGIRGEAQQIVLSRESRYRYPVSSIARRHWSHTAYAFGYLYPVSNLHFWYREEEQAKRNKYSPLFMNIWDMKRIIGLID